MADPCPRCGAEQMVSVGHPNGCAANVLPTDDRILPYAQLDCARRQLASLRAQAERAHSWLTVDPINVAEAAAELESLLEALR